MDVGSVFTIEEGRVAIDLGGLDCSATILSTWPIG